MSKTFTNRFIVHENKKNSLRLNTLPLLGIMVFSILFVYASTLYPGGSQVDQNAEGFDWLHNYWCNLLNEKGMNGKPNPAQPISIAAMIILCLSLMVFFVQFAEVYSENLFWKRTIKIGGILSMLSAIFLFTKYHDLMTMVSSFFGLFAILGIIREIYKSKLINYKRSGIIGLFLLGLNNYIYYSTQLIEWLPLLQKITFVFILTWLVGLNYKMRKEIKLN